MTKDLWPPEETRYFFQLYAEERRKGNRTTSMNKVGKENIMEAFEERFKRGYRDWNPFRNKYDTCRKKYTKFRKLIKNRTGLGFDSMGRIEMSEDWWSEREKTEAFETETHPLPQTQRQTQTHSGSSRGKRKRKEKDMLVESSDKRTEALVVKNRLAERLLERQEASSVENMLEILSALPGVIEWSPLYEASVELLIDSEGNRKGFIAMKTDEAKIRFLVVVDIFYMYRPVIERWKLYVRPSQMNMVGVVYLIS